MAKCGLCSTKKGKRYCSPLDRVICPICCAESRMVKINCNEDCRFLEGISFQQKRSEDKEFSELMSLVGHGQYDDIFQQSDVAMMAYEIESLIYDSYIKGDMGITDTSVNEAYKYVYKIFFQGKEQKDGQLDELVTALLMQYKINCQAWREKLDEETMGQVYLRLMISIKNMSGGQFGEYGYLNYLKNNMAADLHDDEFITEDKFGNKIRRKLR
jgi:hypothetical protein